jgi:membrane-associated protease RseP (regulator of RpoE activity)
MPPVEGYDRYDPIKKWGPGSGLHKTTDGGKTWKKLTKGLPTNHLGRVGLDWYRKDPSVVFAIIDCARIATGAPPSRAYLGVQGEDAGKNEGAKLTSVTEDSPAAKSGFKSGDIVTAVDKKAVAGFDAFVQTFADRKIGDKLIATVKRGKDTVEVPFTLGRRPLSPQDLFAAAVPFGATGDPVTGGGLRLTRFFDDSAAAAAGLENGDVITSVDNQPVTSRERFVEMLEAKKPGDKLAIAFTRDKDKKTATVVLRDVPRDFGPGGASPTRPYNYMYGGQQPNIQAQQGKDGHELGGVYKSTDAGESWTRVNSLNPRPMYFSQIRVDPSDDKFVYVCGVSLHRSKDGGKTFSADGNRGVHPDQHALWIDPRDGRHMIVGCDGGFYATYDRMEHWDFLNHMAIGQFYHVAVDSRRPYRVMGGLQDNGTWNGPSQSRNGPILNEDWLSINGGDGFQCRIDPNDPDLLYFEIQDGGMARRHLKTGDRASIRPTLPRGARPYRFNWNTPIILSAHNPMIFYCAGNVVFRSLKQGAELKAISPEITRTKRGSATALAESPRNSEVIWAGSDDGFLWVTRDGGANWLNVTANVQKAGLPGYIWVSTIEASRFADGRAYVAFDAHRSNNDNPYLFVTEDFGATWKPIHANLPWGSTRCCREDVKNPDLLLAGTEFAAFASLNRGESWVRINSNLPTVAVHDFAIHPTAGEVVAATHGRSLWVMDITPLRQMTASALKAKAQLYEPNVAVRWNLGPERGSSYGIGSRRFNGENPPPGAHIYYSLTSKADKFTLKVTDVTGKTVRELSGSRDPGLHRVTWDLRGTAPGGAAPTGRGPRGGGAGGGGGGGGGGRGPGGGFGGFAPIVSPGIYRVVLTVDGQEFSQAVRVEADPSITGLLIAGDEE